MARHAWLALVPMLLLHTGCISTEDGAHPSFMKRLQNQAITPDLAVIEVALLEQPPGNDYINHQLWRHTDELIVNLQRRGVLEENGFRVGQLVGASPAAFQELLLSERWTKTNSLIFPAGQPKTIYLSPANQPQATYALADREVVTLDEARFGFDVTARFAADGRTTFLFTPKVEHGDLAFPFHTERMNWVMKLERPAKVHPELSWEVTLGPNQVLIIGCRTEREGSLGQASFLVQDGTSAVQRLLVIRNVRSVNAREAYENNVEKMIREDRAMPLALQATMPTQRPRSSPFSVRAVP